MKFMQRNTIVISMATLAGLFSTAGNAGAPHLPDVVQYGNRWQITFFDDSSALHNQWATQGICFYASGVVGTQQRYVWVSDTYPDWNGVATQEGDQLFMHGDFQWPFGNRDGGHDGMEWQLTNLKEGAGHWKEWIENGAYGINVGFGNARLIRSGYCQKPGFEKVDTALDASLKLEQARNEDGSFMENPMGISVKEAQSRE